MPRQPRRRLPFADRLAIVGILLSLLLRIVLPALHDHAPPSPLAPAAVTSCSCGHAHALHPLRAPAGERADDDTIPVPPCHCLACELETGVPGAPPPTAAPMPVGNLPAGTVLAPPRDPVLAANATPYAGRAPPPAGAVAFAAG